MKIISGIECVRIIGKEKGLQEEVDVLETTQHNIRYKEDFALAKKMGMDLLRVGIPWHCVEKQMGVYDWEWVDEYLGHMKDIGIEPIIDPLHHVSIPSWLTEGFLDDRFVSSYSRFFSAIVNRYPWINKFTIVNEPTVTTHFACNAGVWYPFAKGYENHVKGLDHIYRILYNLSHYLRLRGKEHWYIDSCEYHYGVCEASNCHAKYKNEVFRFELLDKLLFQKEPAYISILGLDYYSHSEFQWGAEGREIATNPVGYAEVVRQYKERYNLPVAMTETNVRGTISDRQTWFVHAYKQCVKAGVDIICWYPLVDSTDWCTLVTECNKFIDPQGIIWLDKDFNRMESEFSDSIKKLNFGEITIDEVKEYPYNAPLDETLKYFKNA